MVLQIKYQGSKPCGFRPDIYMIFSLYAYVKHVTPGAGPLLVPGYNLNKLRKSPRDDATYQISRFYALWFQTRRFLEFYLENLFLPV